MVEYISIANCFGSLFQKFFSENFFSKVLLYRSSTISPLAGLAPRVPDPSDGTLFLFLPLGTLSVFARPTFRGPRSVWFVY